MAEDRLEEEDETLCSQESLDGHGGSQASLPFSSTPGALPPSRYRNSQGQFETVPYPNPAPEDVQHGVIAVTADGYNDADVTHAPHVGGDSINGPLAPSHATLVAATATTADDDDKEEQKKEEGMKDVDDKVEGGGGGGGGGVLAVGAGAALAATTIAAISIAATSSSAIPSLSSSAAAAVGSSFPSTSTPLPLPLSIPATANDPSATANMMPPLTPLAPLPPSLLRLTPAVYPRQGIDPPPMISWLVDIDQAARSMMLTTTTMTSKPPGGGPSPAQPHPHHTADVALAGSGSAMSQPHPAHVLAAVAVRSLGPPQPPGAPGTQVGATAIYLQLTPCCLRLALIC